MHINEHIYDVHVFMDDSSCTRKHNISFAQFIESLLYHCTLNIYVCVAVIKNFI